MDCMEPLELAKILRNNQLGAPTQIPRAMPQRGNVASTASWAVGTFAFSTIDRTEE
jgi:hypothetical protein